MRKQAQRHPDTFSGPQCKSCIHPGTVSRCLFYSQFCANSRGHCHEPQGHSPCSCGVSSLVTARILNTHQKEAMDLCLCWVLGRKAAGFWESRQQPGWRALQLRNQFHILGHSSWAPASRGAWLFKLGRGEGKNPVRVPWALACWVVVRYHHGTVTCQDSSLGQAVIYQHHQSHQSLRLSGCPLLSHLEHLS